MKNSRVLSFRHLFGCGLAIFSTSYLSHSVNPTEVNQSDINEEVKKDNIFILYDQETNNYIKFAKTKIEEIILLLENARKFALHSQQTADLDPTKQLDLHAKALEKIAAIDNIVKKTFYRNKKILDGTAGMTAVSTDDKTNKISFINKFNQVPITPSTVNEKETITHQESTSGPIKVNLITRAKPAIITGAVRPGYMAWNSVLGVSGNLTINSHTFSFASIDTTVGEVVNAINNTNLGITARFNPARESIILTSNNLGSDQTIHIVDTKGIIIPVGTCSVSGVDAKAEVTLGTTTVTFDQGKGTLLQDLDGNKIYLSDAGNATDLPLNTPVQVGQLTLGDYSFHIDANSLQPVNISLPNCSSSHLSRNIVAGLSLADVDLRDASSTANSLLLINQAIKDLTEQNIILTNIQKNLE